MEVNPEASMEVNAGSQMLLNEGSAGVGVVEVQSGKINYITFQCQLKV